MRASGGRGAAAVVDFVGTSETASLAQTMLAKNGTLVIVGLFGGELTVPTHFFPLRNATVRGSYTGGVGELRALLRLVQDRALAPLPLACRPMGEVPRILEEMRAGRVVGRVVVAPERRP
jgi:D-arabinose 1-dehydrogenase-like Zn-dependent alcohol dehydrogenase